MHWISEKFINEQLHVKELIIKLKDAFREDIIKSPPKSAYTYRGINTTEDNIFLFMPAWDNNNFFGTKLLTATSNNPQIKLPYIQGLYILFDAKNGTPLAGMDAKVMTNYRTAATSALAASCLAKKETNILLVIGNGSLATYFIRAHTSVRTYTTIYLWGRRKAPSEHIKNQLRKENISIEIIDDFRKVSKRANVISCITSARSALLKKADLGKGQHIDLAGSFTPDMHEVTTDVITSCTVYTDNTDTTPHHAGELVKAMDKGVFTLKNIRGDLAYLCKQNIPLRCHDEENTLFKSTGMALEDLVAARLIYEKFECSKR